MSADPYAHLATVPDLDDFLDEEEAPPSYGRTEWVDSETGEVVPWPRELPEDDSDTKRLYRTSNIDGPYFERRPTPFSVENDGTAEWAMRKLGGLKAKLAEKRQFAKDRKEAIDRWLGVITNPLLRSIAFFEKLLEDYAFRYRDLDPKRNKTLVLPSGSVATTSHSQAVDIEDKGALTEWLVNVHHEFRDGWCKTTYEPQISRFKEDIEVVLGASCSGCGQVLVPATEDERLASGVGWFAGDRFAYCIVVKDIHGIHVPVRTDEGEILRFSVVVVKGLRIPIPGLVAVDEHVTATVRPALDE